MQYSFQFGLIVVAALNYGISRPIDCGYEVGGSRNEKCPRMVEDDDLWQCLNKRLNCREGLVYHCLRNEQGTWTEVCSKEELCDMGKEPMVTNAGNIVCRYCYDSERYNPEKDILSNKLSECPNIKTKCVKEKNDRIECEEPYIKTDPNSKYKMDRKCRCGYEEDKIPWFYDISRDNWTCSFPEVMQCLYSPCPKDGDGRNQTRGIGYRCYPVETVSLVAASTPTASSKLVTRATEEDKRTTTTRAQKVTGESGKTEAPTGVETKVVVVVVASICAFAVIVFLAVWFIVRWFKKRKKKCVRKPSVFTNLRRQLYKKFRRKPSSLLDTSPRLKEEHMHQEGYKRVLNILNEELKQDMDPKAVLGGLKKYDVGRANNHMNIRDEPYTYEKNDMILNLIKGFDNYKKFKRILWETNHIDLLQQMKTAEDSILSEAADKEGDKTSAESDDDSCDNVTVNEKDNSMIDDEESGSYEDDNDNHFDENKLSRKDDGKESKTDQDRDKYIEPGISYGVEDKNNFGSHSAESYQEKSKRESCNQEDMAKQLLISLIGKSWTELVKSSKLMQDVLTEHLEIPKRSRAQIRESQIYQGSEDSLPEDLEAFESSPNGDCLYNSVSLALFGDEGAANRLRLAAVFNGVDRCKSYIKNHISDRNNIDDMTQFMQSRLTDESLRGLDTSRCKELDYLAEFTIHMAVRETIKPGSYSSPLQVLFLSSAIGFPILQYFQAGNPNLYALHARECDVVIPLDQETQREDCIRILWVAETVGKKLNHIVPVMKKVKHKSRV